ncbi:MAG: UPF0280 family protein, partial [Acetobacteraceae bacterium]
TILDELCAELSLLRAPATPDSPRAHGATARRMQSAVAPHAVAAFITPMAAVAGAVAEEVLAAMQDVTDLSRAYVNNGGDIALHLASGERLALGLVDRPDQPSLFARTTVEAAEPVRGVATSGWRGRSHSLGIADAVTVLADTASAADAAATMIANAVDLPGHAAITRLACSEIDPDSDLGDRLVTHDVGALADDEIEAALANGATTARGFVAAGLVRAAALHLRGVTLVA